MRRLWITGMLVATAAVAWGDADPPSRVARLNFLSGAVSFQAAGEQEWTAATVNYPLTTGDHLWVDEHARGEMHIGSAALRLDSRTAFAFLTLDDRLAQLRLSEGSLNVSIRHLAEDESFEVDTPNGAITLLRPGVYRINADPDRETTIVTVRAGEAEVSTNGAAFPVHAHQSAFLTGTDAPSNEVRSAVERDNFDQWAESRDEREERRPAPRYVSRDMIGYEDLDEYGSWSDYPGYGMVWMPRVSSGWAPYHYGHWVWVEPWGWTWVDDAPWGFAPFHYGRWAYVGRGWAWIPGPVAVRPVYAPALVAFVGGSNWHVGLGMGGGGVAWFPLGPREIYRPAYRASPVYVNRVNVTNVTNITNVNVTNVNVTNVHYVNQTAPGGVTAVSRADFAGSRSVARSSVNVPANALARQPVAASAPLGRAEFVAARRTESVGSVSRPPQAVLSRPVVTKAVPAATTIPATRIAPQQPVVVSRPVTPAQAQPQVAPRANTDRPPYVQREGREQRQTERREQAQPQTAPRVNIDRPPTVQREPREQVQPQAPRVNADRPPAVQREPREEKRVERREQAQPQAAPRREQRRDERKSERQGKSEAHPKTTDK